MASVVFFTHRFQPDVRAWLAEVGSTGDWAGGVSAWLGSSLRESSPFNTPWRNVRGGLWDIGPHMVSLLWAALGPVTAVTADAGRADITHLVLHHQGGATSTTTVTLTASAAAEGFEMWVWGEHGRSAAPAGNVDEVAAMRTALAELVASADGWGRRADPRRAGGIRVTCGSGGTWGGCWPRRSGRSTRWADGRGTLRRARGL